MKKWYYLILPFTLFLVGCDIAQDQAEVDSTFEKEFQEQLILADSGAVINIPEGRYSFTRSVSLDGVDGVSIVGAGRDKSFLSFELQKDGAEGLLIKANNIRVEGFTIEDSEGDAIKLQDCKNVVLRDLRTTWTHGAKSTNGGYGIYPVACTNVLVENCEASYASDAGIYIGQSSHVVMRNNFAHHNVAGIEIENSTHVDAYENIAEENTGGILIFDMPGLPKANGGMVKVHHNISRNNNFENFAPEGGVVATLPPGSGMVVIASRDVEIYENEVTGYKTLGLGIISWYMTERPFDLANGYDPYCKNVYVHDNTFTRKRALPDLSKDFGKMINALYPGRPQDIMIDGIFDPDDNATGVCLQRNGDDLRFTNLNATDAKGISDLKQSLDNNIGAVDCALASFEVMTRAD